MATKRIISSIRRREIEAAFFRELEKSPVQSFFVWAKLAGHAEDRSKFYRIMHGDALPNAVDACRIARAAGTTVEALWGDAVEVPAIAEPETEQEAVDHEG